MRLLKEIRNLMGNYHVKSGIYHYYRNEFKQAVDFFRRALREGEEISDTDRRTARFYLTQTFVQSAEKQVLKGDLDAAIRDFVRGVEVSPDFPDIRFRLGEVYELADRLPEAVEEYRQAVALNENYGTARTALAFCLLRVGRDDEAAEAFREVLEHRIRRLRVPYEKGLQRLREGMAVEAREFFQEAFLADVHRFEAAYRDALGLLKAEDFEGALKRLDEAIELCPKFGDLHNYRGVALCELGRTDEGIVAFKRSLTLNPEYVVAKLNLAFAHLRAGQFKEAEAALEAVLEQDPNQSAASSKLEELRTGRAVETRRGVRGGAR